MFVLKLLALLLTIVPAAPIGLPSCLGRRRSWNCSVWPKPRHRQNQGVTTPDQLQPADEAMECSICHQSYEESTASTERVVLEECRHGCHKKCWDTYVRDYVREQDLLVEESRRHKSEAQQRRERLVDRVLGRTVACPAEGCPHGCHHGPSLTFGLLCRETLRDCLRCP